MTKNSTHTFPEDVRSFIKKHQDIVQIAIEFIEQYPELKPVANQMIRSYMMMVDCFDNGGRLFLCGNGGSFADCLHISGEMLKSYERKRGLNSEDKKKFKTIPFGDQLSRALEYGLPVIVLGLNHSLKSAVENDIFLPNIGYAQELFALGEENDVLLGISTSGMAMNVAYAVSVAKVKGMRTIGLTGEEGGQLAPMVDVAIKAPGKVTKRIQENHQIIYHTVCSLVETHYFQEKK
ncbi:SIS domain-containing protein [candidate division KSB1 bacterium]|nr:SIS domain-containing protein [candidate division KSB1 bacterium]